jgi:hypothetical protein
MAMALTFCEIVRLQVEGACIEHLYHIISFEIIYPGRNNRRRQP